MKVDFVGLGAQKAATSWLHKCLEEHPEICMAKGKEVHFFSRHYNKGEDWYHNWFACNEGQVHGEISTSYLSSKEAPERIKAYRGDIKLIVILRDPVARSRSHIRHLRSKGKINAQTPVPNVISQYPEVLENSLYGRGLSRYFDIFMRSQARILFFEDIQKKPQEVIRDVYSFLGVDTSFVPKALNVKYNTSMARSSRLFWIVNKMYLRCRKSAIGRALIRVIRSTGLNAILLERVLQKKGGAEEANEELDSSLKHLLQSDIQLCRTMLSRKDIEWLHR